MNDDITVNTASIPEELQSFITAYRDSLKSQYDTAVAALDQQRQNDYAKIMNSAKAKNALHSNFTGREKVVYDTQTYQPALTSARQSYQTGIDTLRENVVNTANQIKSLQEKIADLNEV